MKASDRTGRLWRELYEEGGAHVIRELLRLDPAQVDAAAYGMTLLHVAAGMGYEGEVTLLLGRGANVNAADATGQTPLHRAAHNRDPVVCLILLEHGAQPSARDHRGRTPADCARPGDPWASREDHEQTMAPLGEPG